MADISSFRFKENPPYQLIGKKEIFYKNDKEQFIYTRQKFLKSVFEELISGTIPPIKQAKGSAPAINIPKEIDGVALSEAEQSLLKVRERFDFFKNMEDRDVLAVTKDVSFLKLSKNEILFEQGSEGEDVFFIIKGFILISIEGKEGERVDLARLGQESIFGEMAPITKEKRSARATALMDGTTLLSFKINEEKDGTNPTSFLILYKNFTHILAKKLINANRIIAKRQG